MAGQTDIFNFVAADEAATLRCAAWLAGALPSPALVFLNGDLGAGKTAFARGFIRALHGQETIVPSPTFTLMQIYEDAPAVLHADLYRLGEAEEIDQLGLLDALSDHICLVEWAEKAETLLPSPDVMIALDMPDSEDHGGDDCRHVKIEAPQHIIGKIRDAAARDAALTDFLADTIWADAARAPLAGDASTRRYERLHGDKKSAILMDWAQSPDGPAIYDGRPYSQVAHLAEAMPRFADMVAWLNAHDCPAPTLYAVDRDNGFALLEDFGDHIITRDASIDRDLFYHEAVENLIHLHKIPAAGFLPAYDGAVQAVEASLFTDWYLPYRGHQLSEDAKAEWQTLWQALGDKLWHENSAEKPVTVLRDYHSVNLLWRDTAQARYRIGLIDVQDALQGHAAYDVASLIYDARIKVAPHHQTRILAHYLAHHFIDDKDRFMEALAICAVQRNLKIAGIFVRLAQRDGKTAYLQHLPRVLGYIKAHIDAPVLADINAWLNRHAPDALVVSHGQ